MIRIHFQETLENDQSAYKENPMVYAVGEMIRIHHQETLEHDQSSYTTCHFLPMMFVDDSFVDTNLEAVSCKRLRDAFRLLRFVSVCLAPICMGGHDRAVGYPYAFYSLTAFC